MIIEAFMVIVGAFVVYLCILELKDMDKQSELKKEKLKKKEEEDKKLLEWRKNKKDHLAKRWSEIAEKNPGLTSDELKHTYIRHYPEENMEDINMYLKERDKIIAQPTGKIVRYEKKYNGNNLVLCILLCIGIIPGLLYYLLARETVPIYEEE